MKYCNCQYWKCFIVQTLTDMYSIHLGWRAKSLYLCRKIERLINFLFGIVHRWWLFYKKSVSLTSLLLEISSLMTVVLAKLIVDDFSIRKVCCFLSFLLRRFIVINVLVHRLTFDVFDILIVIDVSIRNVHYWWPFYEKS